jgi:hypothetical protein
VPADSERNKQPPPMTRLPKGVISFLTLRVTDIAANNQRLIEEDIFSLLRRNSMLLPVLLCIRVVPIETNALIQRAPSFRHDY